MRLIRFIVVLTVLTVCCFTASADSPETFPTLAVGSVTYSNVTVTSHTSTHLSFTHKRGIATVKLEDLSPEMQNHFGYDPAAEQPPEKTGPERLPATPLEIQLAALTNTRPPNTVLMKYPIASNATLYLFRPAAWKDTFVPAPPGSPQDVSIRFERTFDQNFEFVISTISDNSPLKKMSERALLEMTGSRALLKSYETSLNFQRLAGPEINGSYFTLTDRALMDVSEPKPGHYKFQTQGYVTVQGTPLIFGMLYNFPNTGDFRNALAMITNAIIVETTDAPPPATNGLMVQGN